MYIEKRTYEKNQERKRFQDPFLLFWNTVEKITIEAFKRDNFYYLKFSRNGEPFSYRRLSIKEFKEAISKPHIVKY